MSLLNDIPASFWSLFRSCNRETYIGALLKINEEYEYSNYYLSRELCIQILGDYFEEININIWRDEYEDDLDALEPAATRVLNWLIRTKWLRKVEDYNHMTTNIVIPDYAAVMIEAMEKLSSDETDDTQIYIQNIYAILFSLKNDRRANLSLLKTALVNTRKLNKTLQDMLHNMDKFFSNLLEQKEYSSLLKDHLEVYVQEVVQKKYHILKTSDNFYMYKADSKKWIKEMQENDTWIEEICIQSAKRDGKKAEEREVIETLELIDKGFDDIEQRIYNMDREHSKYIRATVSRLNYLLNEEDDMKGLIVNLLKKLSECDDPDDKIAAVSEKMNLSGQDILSSQSLYRRRKKKISFEEELSEDEEEEELSKEDILSLNKIKKRYSRQQIEEFVKEKMRDGRFSISESSIENEEEFEKLILAYDYSIRKTSVFSAEIETTEDDQPEMAESNGFKYPKLIFRMKK